MLAPVLARLQAIPGIADAGVECSGTYFLLTGRGEGDAERALPAIRDVLGPRSRVVEGAERDAQLEARARGDSWFSVRDIRMLSYVEGRILATRMTDAVTAAVRLDPATTDRIHEAVRVEVFAALDHAHDSGGRSSSGWFWIEWPHIVDRITARVAGRVGDAERNAIDAALRAQAPGAR